MLPADWNSMSLSATPPGALTWAKLPLAWRLKMAPAAVVNQNREADWYSIAVMFWVVPDGTSVQMLAAEAGAAARQEPTRAAATRPAWRNGKGMLIPDRSFR